mmetsp:Transcript_9317/g.16162  ORF Transcript_9317/g.16162 Transcript_9317/m.16162 type:complete len:261 (-) Transcript_9317:120-902(-)
MARAGRLWDSVARRWKQGWDPIPPPGKSGQIRFGWCHGEDEDPEVCTYIYTLKAELANSYYWSGNFLVDLLFFICNWHPLIGIILSHPNHPWTKRQRLSMMLLSLSITMVPSAYIGIYHILWEERLFYTILFVTLPDTVLGAILYQLSIAETRRWCGLCAPLWTCIRQCLFCITLTLGGLSTCICYVILQVEGETRWGKMLEPLFFGLALSYITWLPLHLVLPCKLGFFSNWCAEQSSGCSAAAEIEEQARAGDAYGSCS